MNKLIPTWPQWRQALKLVQAGIWMLLLAASGSLYASDSNKLMTVPAPTNSTANSNNRMTLIVPTNSSIDASRLMAVLAQINASSATNGAGLTNTGLRIPDTNLQSIIRFAMTNAMAILDDKQKLGPGDRVSYRVYEDQDEPKSLTITDAGDIEVPYYGLHPANNKTCYQLASEIKTLLEKQHYYRATVVIALEIFNKKRILGKIYITGQVRITGAIEIPSDEPLTVSRAILKAGGFSDFADQRKVRLVRKNLGTDKKTFIINVAEIWEKGKMENDMNVEPEDLIFVSARLINF